MKRKLFKIGVLILIFLLVKEIILTTILNHNTTQSINSYFKNETSFNYKSDFVIEIPKIKLKSVIKKADKNFRNLNKSLVYYEYDNYKEKIIVFGHSGVGYGTYFNRLDELYINDYLYLYKDKLKIIYIVNKKYSIYDTEINILQNDKKNTLLLITCEKSNKSKRLVIELKVKSIKTVEK